MKPLLTDLRASLVLFETGADSIAHARATPLDVLQPIPMAKEHPGQVCALIMHCKTAEEANSVRATLSAHAAHAKKSYIRAAQAQSRLRKVL